MLLVTTLLTLAAAQTAHPEEYINVNTGTANTEDMSRGNVLPEATLPWGFNGWAPITESGEVDNTGGFWFSSRTFRMYGMRLTHQPSPWTNDYGNMRFMAHLASDEHHGVDDTSGYDPRSSIWRPYYQKHTLVAYCGSGADNCLTFELTPTEHGAIMRFKFPAQTTPATADLNNAWNQTRRLLVAMNPNQMGKNPWLPDVVTNPAPGADGLATLTGLTTRCDNEGAQKFAHYFHLTVAGGADGTDQVTPMQFSNPNKNAVGILDFKPEDVKDDTLIVRVATSFISPAQAEGNYKAEVAGVKFDDAMAAAKLAWHDVVSPMDIVDVGSGYSPVETEDWKTIFYTSMYRAAKYPRKLWETDHATQKPIHWSPYMNGTTQPGKLSSDQGFWDAYRSTYSWLALVNPARFAEAMDGWLTAFNELGWVPQWAHPNSQGGAYADDTTLILILTLTLTLRRRHPTHTPPPVHLPSILAFALSALSLMCRRPPLTLPPPFTLQE